MKWYLLLIFFIAETATAQSFERPYQDERRAYMEIGVGAGASKAGAAYTVKPLFLENTRLGWQVFLAPQVIVSPRINLGLRLGGVFRPKFTDLESNSELQGKFTPYGLLFGDYYFGAPGKRNTRFFIGLGGGGTYIGKLEARHLQTDEAYFLRRKDQDIFLTIVPRAGVVIGDLKIQVEHIVTTPFNPDITSITLSNTIPMGRRKYF
ncbi:hypothetical protein [Arundinibacter roseus]|uniref:Outer membrane protein beta-barrel domain-containing protein n=1 Tax=Arundinibacter roseus TaxID=2070510 RepID=A0A4R4KKY7_9BACT|nr:hypothetical protein [Arundinibacter roseus]TDB68970.1 hypothetical protein EZE20_01120 [Arundinibacter roseus]